MNIHTIDLQFLGEAHNTATFLVENGQDLVLIETGPYSTFPTLKKSIEDLGFQISDIKNVLLTHIHLDHAGAAWAFAEAGATIYVHPFGAKNLIDPSRLMESARRIYQDQMESLWGAMQAIPEAQLKTVAHEELLQIGDLTFKAWHTPGHASHHIAWQLNDIVFTGDVAGVCIKGSNLVVAPLPPPDIDIEIWKNSIALLRTLNTSKFYLTHFDFITNIQNHLDKLEENIALQSNWVLEHWRAGESAEEMTAPFDEFCKQNLLEKGLPQSELAKYQAANPAWMSVAGLVRYWKKKTESL